MAGSSEWTFQNGENKYSYKYNATGETCNGYPIYECRRGTSYGPVPHDEGLYLAKLDGHWAASLGAPGCARTTNPSLREPVFRAASAGDDPRNAGSHAWQYWDKGAWEGNTEFWTYVL